MTAAWPSTLPDYVLQQGYDEKWGSTSISTSMEIGPAKKRNRTTAGIDRFQVQLLLTSDEVDALKIFWKTTVARGTLPFTWVNPREQTAVTFRFLGDDAPDIKPSNDSFVASFALEILP